MSFRQVNDIVLSQSITGAATFSSDAIDCLSLIGAYIRVSNTGTAAGNIQMQASVKEKPQTDADWDNEGSTVAYTGGTKQVVKLTDVYARWIRVQLINASGTSTALVEINAKCY